MPDVSRLSVRATVDELERWRGALVVAIPDQSVSAAVRSILDAIARSPRYAREVLGDVLFPGCAAVAAARSEHSATLAEEEAHGAALVGRGPAFPGDPPWGGPGDGGGRHPCDPELNMNGRPLPHGPLAGQAGEGARDLAHYTAGWYRARIEGMRRARTAYHARRVEALDEALAADPDASPVYVLTWPGGPPGPGPETVLAVAESKDLADRMARKTSPKLLNGAVGSWRADVWLALWKREGSKPFQTVAAKQRLLAGVEGGAE